MLRALGLAVPSHAPSVTAAEEDKVDDTIDSIDNDRKDEDYTDHPDEDDGDDDDDNSVIVCSIAGLFNSSCPT